MMLQKEHSESSPGGNGSSMAGGDDQTMMLEPVPRSEHV